MVNRPCSACGGTRLNAVARAVDIDGMTIAEVANMAVVRTAAWVRTLQGPQTPLTPRQQMIAESILKEIRDRLEFLNNVGLDYLTLSRSAGSLSGGEAQRIRLATQIGSRLMGVLYVLDEPSIGSPARQRPPDPDAEGYARSGNTVSSSSMTRDDPRSRWVVDLGPGAGKHGVVLAEGPPEEIAEPDPPAPI